MIKIQIRNISSSQTKLYPPSGDTRPRFTQDEIAYLTTSIQRDIQDYNAASDNVNHWQEQLNRLHDQDNPGGELDDIIRTTEDTLMRFRHDKSLFASIIGIKSDLYGDSILDCGYEAWSWVTSDIGRWQGGNLENLQHYVNNVINTHYSAQFTQAIAGYTEEASSIDSSNVDHPESTLGIDGNNSDDQSEVESTYFDHEITTSDEEELTAPLEPITPLFEEEDSDENNESESESNFNEKEASNKSALDVESGEEDVPSTRDPLSETKSFPNTSGLGLKTGDVHQALPTYHLSYNSFHQDNSEIESSENKSTIDYVLEKQKTDMPDIVDSDAGE